MLVSRCCVQTPYFLPLRVPVVTIRRMGASPLPKLARTVLACTVCVLAWGVVAWRLHARFHARFHHGKLVGANEFEGGALEEDQYEARMGSHKHRKRVGRHTHNITRTAAQVAHDAHRKAKLESAHRKAAQKKSVNELIGELSKAYDQRTGKKRANGTKAARGAKRGEYVVLSGANAGANCSATLGLEAISSFEECRAAVAAVGGLSLYPKVQSKKHFQRGCSKCNAGCSTWDRDVLFFNTRSGEFNSNHDTVCVKTVRRQLRNSSMMSAPPS